MSYVIQAVLSNAQHPEYGQVTIPFPIPNQNYDCTIELLEPLEIGDTLRQDCQVDELDSFYTVLNALIGTQVTLDELDYPALLETIEHHITEYGVAEFVVGQYGNFDRLVIRALSQAKRAHPDITLMLMTPYYPVNRKVDLPEAFDALFYPPDLEAVPKRLAIIRANRYMVERSDFLIAYVRHPASNAKELLEYAGTGKRKGKIHITNLAEEQIPLPKKTDDVI